MGYAITFGVVWAILSALAILMLAAVPTTNPVGNKELAGVVAVCGAETQRTRYSSQP